MSFFDKIFGSGAGEGAVSRGGKWTNILSAEDLQAAVERSYEVPVVIFKHSTRCFISQTVLKNFEREMQAFSGNAEFFFLDLLAHRDLSNKIASDFQVTHQSPQMIVLKNGQAIKNASHQAISLNLV